MSPWWAGYCCVCCLGSPERSSVFPLSVRNYEHVIQASEAGMGSVNRPTEGFLGRALQEVTGNHWWQWSSEHLSPFVRKTGWLSRSEDVVEESHVYFELLLSSFSVQTTGILVKRQITLKTMMSLVVIRSVSSVCKNSLWSVTWCSDYPRCGPRKACWIFCEAVRRSPSSSEWRKRDPFCVYFLKTVHRGWKRIMWQVLLFNIFGFLIG